jgi:hypothetical protein
LLTGWSAINDSTLPRELADRLFFECREPIDFLTESVFILFDQLGVVKLVMDSDRLWPGAFTKHPSCVFVPVLEIISGSETFA